MNFLSLKYTYTVVILMEFHLIPFNPLEISPSTTGETGHIF